MARNSSLLNEDFFNDLSRRADGNVSREQSISPKNADDRPAINEDAEDFVPRTKRIACIVCRKRKLSKHRLPGESCTLPDRCSCRMRRHETSVRDLRKVGSQLCV
jgi:hypothetical protein